MQWHLPCASRYVVYLAIADINEENEVSIENGVISLLHRIHTDPQ